MAKQNKKQRPIDRSVSKASQSLSSRFVLASKTEIKAWKAFVVIMFAAGFFAAMIWSAYNSWYIGSDAKKKENAPAASDSDKKDLAAYWNFDEDDNKTAHDKSGNGNNGTINGATKTRGYSKEALDFDGTDAYVKIPGSKSSQNQGIGGYGGKTTPIESLDITEKITLEAWIYPEEDKNGGAVLDGIVTKGGLWDKDASYQLYFNPKTSRIVGAIRWGQGKRDYDLISKKIEEKKWIHVALTLDGKNNLKLFVNGNAVRSKKLPDGKKMQSSSLDLNIGGAYPDKYQTRFFHGKIDEVRIYKRVLAEDEIQRHAGTAATTLKNLIFFPAGTKAEHKYGDLTGSLMKEVESSPYDSFAIHLSGIHDDAVPSFGSLSDNLSAVKKSGKFVWPRIYLNRIVGCCEAPACLQKLKDEKKCGDEEALADCYEEKSLDTDYKCSDNGFYCQNVCQEKKSLPAYFNFRKNTKGEAKDIDLWDKAGALSDFYKLLETSLKLAKESGAPGIFIDHELYHNYRMYKVTRIAKDNDIKPEEVIKKLEAIGGEVADKVNSIYPQAVLMFASADFSQEQGDGNMRSTNYIVEGILKRAEKKNYPLKVVEGGEKSLWYLHASMDDLKQKMNEQESKMKSYLKKYPKNFVLGGTRGLYLDWKETKGAWNDWLKDANEKNKLEVKTAGDITPLMKYLGEKREYVWIFSGAPSSKGYDEFSYSENKDYISQFRNILRPLFCGNNVCDTNRGESEKSCPADCAKEDEKELDTASDDL